jgi:hypothetical protein
MAAAAAASAKHPKVDPEFAETMALLAGHQGSKVHYVESKLAVVAGLREVVVYEKQEMAATSKVLSEFEHQALAVKDEEVEEATVGIVASGLQAKLADSDLDTDDPRVQLLFIDEICASMGFSPSTAGYGVLQKLLAEGKQLDEVVRHVRTCGRRPSWCSFL